MEGFGIKLNETTRYYIGLFTFYGLMLVIMFGSVQLAENTEWFAEFWDSKTNRMLTIYGLPPLLFYIGFQFHSYFWGKKKLIRSFKGVERFQLHDCKNGEKTRIQGKLLALRKTVLAPLSKRECAAYTLRSSQQVERASTSGNGHVRSQTAWETFSFHEYKEDFLIECGGTYALIRTLNAKVIIQPDTIHDEANYDRDKGGFLSPKENELRKNALDAIGVNSRRFTGVYAENIKFEEGILEENEQVAVVGSGQWRKISEIEELHFLADKQVTRVFEMTNNEDIELCISDSKDLLDKKEAEPESQSQ